MKRIPIILLRFLQKIIFGTIGLEAEQVHSKSARFHERNALVSSVFFPTMFLPSVFFFVRSTILS